MAVERPPRLIWLANRVNVQDDPRDLAPVCALRISIEGRRQIETAGRWSVHPSRGRVPISRGRAPTFWKRDERPAESIVIGSDKRLVTCLGISLLIFQLGTNLCDISRYLKKFT